MNSSILILMFSFFGLWPTKEKPPEPAILGQVLVVEEDLFLYERPHRECAMLVAPGYHSDVPPSVECYWTDPENWMHSEEAQARGVSSDIENVRILGVVPSGTRFVVTTVKCKPHPYLGLGCMVYGVLQDPRFVGPEVKCNLFNGVGERGDFDTRPMENFLRPTGIRIMNEG